ncbi:unnamed protein product [Closterium sp. NIES-65]|nr:unnamed protein product [Closterium sp. NIES-65]
MNDPKNRDRPLYLHVSPSTEAKTPEEKQRMVDAAVRMIDDIMNLRPGEQPRAQAPDRADPGRGYPALPPGTYDPAYGPPPPHGYPGYPPPGGAPAPYPPQGAPGYGPPPQGAPGEYPPQAPGQYPPGQYPPPAYPPAGYPAAAPSPYAPSQGGAYGAPPPGAYGEGYGAPSASAGSIPPGSNIVLVFAAFEPTREFDASGRIRGPNDSYLEHIHTSTSIKATLHGRCSNNHEINGEGEGRDGQGEGRDGQGEGRVGQGEGRVGQGEGRVGQGEGRDGQGEGRRKV